jgi:short-subunit dehydrogenase
MRLFTTPNPPLRCWQDKRVWIIGASAGIGLAVCKVLAAQGASLIISGRNEAALLDMANTLTIAQILPYDVSDPEQTTGIMTQLSDPIDVVMVFAGAYTAGSLIQHTGNSITQTIDTNLTGVIQFCHALIPKLCQQSKAHLVVVGSAAAYLPLPNGSVYGASKAGLSYFAQSLYTELKPLGIAVTLVSPGFVRTRLTDKNTFAMPSLLTTEQAAQAIINGLARGKADIAFPWGFTTLLKVINRLPWSWRQAILNRLNQRA